MTVAQGIGRYTLPQLSTHAGFPGLCRMADGRLLRVWRDGPSHTGGTDGRILGQHLDAALRPLDDVYLIADDELDLRDPSVAETDDGSVWLTYFSYETPTAPAAKVWVRRSADGGLTFDAPRRLGPSSYSLAISAPLVQIDDTLVAVTYGKLTVGQAFDAAYAHRSSDGGDTWSRTTLASGPADGRHYQEPWLIRLRSGPLLAALRHGGQDRIAVTVSLDGGATWTAPVPKFLGWGRPMLLELATGPTVCVYRGPTGWPYPALLRVSPDRGGTWSAPVTVDAPDAQMTYAAAAEVADGLAAVLLGGEDSASVSTITGLHVLDIP